MPGFTDPEKARLLRRMRMLEEFIFGRIVTNGDVLAGASVDVIDANGDVELTRTFSEATPRQWHDVP